LNLPALIIHGATDPVPLWTARQNSESIPNAKLVVIKKSGHFSFVEQPKKVFSAIDQFLFRHRLGS
jgi:pimeloyl-ACP methyl ester carboxylesterase